MRSYNYTFALYFDSNHWTVLNDMSKVDDREQVSIKFEGFHSLCDGGAVEYVVDYGSDDRAEAANVIGPDDAFVQGSTRGSYDGRAALVAVVDTTVVVVSDAGTPEAEGVVLIAVRGGTFCS
ncbi:hypothetical protein Salat_1064200 [Sesamum alatum]|uniref:Uncharacterized protein n=1 Tax=Sesamum alatum TaxID=300844 RepID=A0AAE1YM82_9LAMI|nr:hypothetical protein Salat_1064200 [Sesamum alatum]